MCESNIVRKEGSSERMIAEDIDHIKIISDKKLLVRTIMGQETYIDGTIDEIDLHRHRVFLK